MSDELFPVNTPETLGLSPNYILQHNAVSRSAHKFSDRAKKLTAMAMALLPADLSNLSVSFTLSDFCKAIGFEDGGEQGRILKETVYECMKSVIEVEVPSKKRRKPGWVMFHWFQMAEFNSDGNVCTMIFAEELAEFLKELRMRFGIASEPPPENWEFRLNMLEAPSGEINAGGINGAGIGEAIRPQSTSEGDPIEEARLEAKASAKSARKKRVKKDAVPPAGLPEASGID